jgi:Cft2 family RNA processing exonuclease
MGTTWSDALDLLIEMGWDVDEVEAACDAVNEACDEDFDGCDAVELSKRQIEHITGADLTTEESGALQVLATLLSREDEDSQEIRRAFLDVFDD